ncbi:MAG: type III pantothenate kinase [Dehalococcoidia bacterium]
MLLAIDIGNTNITLGVFQGESLKATWRLATEPRTQPDEYGLTLNLMLPTKGIALDAIEAVAMCSVVPPLMPVFEEVCRGYLHLEPLVVGAGTKTGVRVLYENPRDVGTDRIVDTVGAYHLYGGPTIVVDFGTATVFDAISRDGDYLGGAIAPGLNLASETLYLSTSQLRRVELVRPKAAIGKNTVSALQSGLIFGYVSLVEGMVRRFREELDGEAKVVATGGQAHLIARETPLIDVVNPDLTLIGLRLVHEMNRTPQEGG